MHLLSAILVLGLSAQTVEFTVDAGPHDRKNTPVRVPLKEKLGNAATLTDASGQGVPCQVTGPNLLSESGVSAELHFILPALKAGSRAAFKASFRDEARDDHPGWQHLKGHSSLYRFGERAALRYEHAPLDESSKEARQRTNKVFHHLYDPSGSRLVTNGPGGRYPHHRGIFYGFGRITYGDGRKCNTWACSGNAYQAHDGFVAREGGPVLGRHLVKIRWHGAEKEPFADEKREVTVFNVPGGNLVEFRSELSARLAPIRLDGDPQHAGFHFRADNEVNDKWAGETTYIRPDGKGQPGKTRNWPAVKTHANLPWNAMCFRLGEKKYTAAYLDHPDNPKEARFSERPYGRFGSYFVYELKDRNARCRIDYRVWIQDGEMTPAEVSALSADFVSPPKVTVK